MGWDRKPEVKFVLLDVITDHDVAAGKKNTERLFAKHCNDCLRQDGSRKKHHGQKALQNILRSAEFRRLLIFRPFDAPGLVIIGAEYEFSTRHETLQHSATGCGRCFCSALLRLFGESAEYETRYRLIRVNSDLPSPCSLPGTLVSTKHPADPNRQFPKPINSTSECDLISALRLNDGKTVRIPADACFLTVNCMHRHGVSLSAGLGADLSLTLARQHAIAEVVEHDAVALWWYGGRQSRRIRFDANSKRNHAQFRQSIRQSQNTRSDFLLDISTDLNVPCVVSISFDLSGQTFACGSAARRSYPEAIKAAYREMCQMEYAHHLVREKLDHVELSELNAVDRGHVRRATVIKPANFLFQTNQETTITEENSSQTGVSPNAIQSRLLAAGLQLLIVDLSKKDETISVVKALAPDLQPLARDIVTTRLARVIDQTGGGHQHNHGVDP